MESIKVKETEITGGYWKTRQEINSTATLRSVYERFKETHRFDALKCEWKDGDPDMPHIFWDSDVAKWIEGASYILNFKDDEEKKLNIGVIAQELRDILPEKYKESFISGHETEEDHLSVNETKLLYVALLALKDQEKRIAELEKKLGE